MDKEHRMFLLSADLRKVYAMLAKKFNEAPLAQQEEYGIRNPENAVQGRDGAPESE